MHADAGPPGNRRPQPDSARQLGEGPARPATAPGARLFRPEMLMIGAMCRNSGKTELACRIIGRHAAAARVAALKVTAVERADGSCPRGGTGCGVCSSLAEPWCVTRELDPDSPKDTSRLLAGGAHEVHWLRVRHEALADGAAGLLKLVPPGWVCVCESNSLRRVVEPGLFLQVKVADGARVKRSARMVAGLADLVVVSDGESFDCDLERISLLDGQWALRRDACAAVVADPPHGRPEDERAAAIRRFARSLRPQFLQVLIADAPPDPAQSHDDRRLMRVLVEALSRSRHEWCLLASARNGPMPAAIVNAIYRRRAGVDAVVVRGPSGDPRRLLGLFNRRLLPRLLSAGGGDSPAPRALGALGPVRELRFLEGPEMTLADRDSEPIGEPPDLDSGHGEALRLLP